MLISFNEAELKSTNEKQLPLNQHDNVFRPSYGNVGHYRRQKCFRRLISAGKRQIKIVLESHQ